MFSWLEDRPTRNQADAFSRRMNTYDRNYGDCLARSMDVSPLRQFAPGRFAPKRFGLWCLVFTARCTLVQSAVLRSHVDDVVCLSVRLSVTLVNCDHIGWNSSKIISPSVSLGCSLFATQNIMGLLQGEHHEIFARIGVGC